MRILVSLQTAAARVVAGLLEKCHYLYGVTVIIKQLQRLGVPKALGVQVASHAKLNYIDWNILHNRYHYNATQYVMDCWEAILCNRVEKEFSLIGIPDHLLAPERFLYQTLYLNTMHIKSIKDITH
jgi:hypothetical protein